MLRCTACKEFLQNSSVAGQDQGSNAFAEVVISAVARVFSAFEVVYTVKDTTVVKLSVNGSATNDTIAALAREAVCGSTTTCDVQVRVLRRRLQAGARDGVVFIVVSVRDYVYNNVTAGPLGTKVAEITGGTLISAQTQGTTVSVKVKLNATSELSVEFLQNSRASIQSKIDEDIKRQGCVNVEVRLVSPPA